MPGERVCIFLFLGRGKCQPAPRSQRYDGECGRVGSDWCDNGDVSTSGTNKASPGTKAGE